MKAVARLTLLMIIWVVPARAEHEHGGHPVAQDTTKAQAHKEGTSQVDESNPHAPHWPTTELPGHVEMSSILMPYVPMQRDASGTSWLPDQSAVHAIHRNFGGWDWMLHGTAFIRLTSQDVLESGQRGKTTVSAPNWMMVMGERRVARTAKFGLRGMFSLDAATEGGRGYPLLFQTGESFEGQPLIDRQHPHDLFTELSASFGQGWEDGIGYFVYFGYPGEPALGPPSFMHRPSAYHNPDSPLGHHWQDATHTTYGVATAGWRLGMIKLDGSIFNGREPDENRWDLDEARFDSYSGRIAVNLSSHWALQVSEGYLTSPERLEPDVDLYRYTASAIYHLPMRGLGTWATTFLWGTNDPVIKDKEASTDHNTRTQHSFLIESDLERFRSAYYTRIEYVQKASHDLGVEHLGNRLFGIGALTLGAAREIWQAGSLKMMAGAQSSFYAVPGDLREEYG